MTEASLGATSAGDAPDDQYAPVFLLGRRVAANIRSEAARYGDNQAAIADVLGIAQQGVSQRMRGKVEFGLDELAVLADRYGLTPGELVDGTVRGRKWPSSMVRREGIEPPTR